MPLWHVEDSDDRDREPGPLWEQALEGPASQPDESTVSDVSIAQLTQKYRESPGTVTQEEYDFLRDAGAINADGDLYENTDVSGIFPGVT